MIIIIRLFKSPDARLRVVIATIAFGMGIDSPNVRHTCIHVVHMKMLRATFSTLGEQDMIASRHQLYCFMESSSGDTVVFVGEIYYFVILILIVATLKLVLVVTCDNCSLLCNCVSCTKMTRYVCIMIQR